MKKKILLCCGIAVLLIAFSGYSRTIGAPVIGTVTGPEWDCLTVRGVDYERDFHAPVNGTDRGRFMGIATDGETRLRVYSIKGNEDYLLCIWVWEGYIFKRVR